jgi:superfamily II DNA or RNA helicase
MNFDFLYPSLNDPSFNINISKRKEFYDNKYKIPESKNIEEVSDKLCFSDFELAPHQIFVKNFLSSYTPYNSLLLYHGLGTGKTCTAISVAEEMRDYIKQVDGSNKIIIVASPNVQENFKLQLFDERKLKSDNGYWNINSCVGNKYLNEINPLNIKGLTKKQIIYYVKKIINKYYLFFGYTEFGNYISKKSKISSVIELDNIKKETLIKNNLKKNFNNSLIIIDEVHNIRITDDNKKKRIAIELMNLVENVDNIKLLLLSATPMYNSYKEIIWLTNLLNVNDNNAKINQNDVFDSNGNFKISENGKNIGKELLKQKLNGYVSFLSGENPYMFPFRIWPNDFSPENTFLNNNYPRFQLNNKPIIQPLQYLSLYLCDIGSYQLNGYDYILNQLKKEINIDNIENLETEDIENADSLGFGYTLLQKPLQALNIIYPNPIFDEVINNDNNDNDNNDNINFDIKSIIGTSGLSNVMNYENTITPMFKGNFEYKNNNYGRIFSFGEIGKYSYKIKKICENILNSKGVVLIYSQFLDGGLIPIALALEELGFTRSGNNKSFFKNPPTKKIDAITFKTKEKTENFNRATYSMITGDLSISPNNVEELKLATDVNNKNGEKVKVIMISQAGSEGLDFKFIRQVHILEPWYNISRTEQIIGRAVRNCSHKDLNFKERNVEIYLYSTLLNNNIEAVDTYVYRYSEIKAVKIGNVSRLLKQISVDCLLNYDMQKYDANIMNLNVVQNLSSGKSIDYQVGNKPYTYTCDFKENCSYYCNPMKIINNDDVNYNSYNEYYLKSNSNTIQNKIKNLFKKNFFYEKSDLVKHINHFKTYPIESIYQALDVLLNTNQFITDMYDRIGKLINIGDLYIYQPIELNNDNISVFDRIVPIDYKNKKISFIFDDIEDIKESEILDNDIYSKGKLVYDNILINYNKVFQNYNTIRGVKDWYIICSFAINILKNDYNIDLLEELLLEHIMDEVPYYELINLLNYLETLDEQFSEKIKNYVNENMISDNNINGYLTQLNNEYKIIIKNNGKWIPAKEEDKNDLSIKIGEINSKFLPIDKKLNTIVGFMREFKNNFISFKTKNMKMKRNKGARCDQADRRETLNILNKILNTNKYDNDNTNKNILCIILEFTLRILNKENKNNKIWFLKPYESALVNIEKVSF